MYGWPVLSVFLFLCMPARRAAISAVLGGWLLLPQGVVYQISGIPDYTRETAIFLGALIGLVIFDLGSVMRAKWGVWDLPIAVWCLSPLPSSITNGLGVYDGLSGVLEQLVIYGTPYLIGRCHFAHPLRLGEMSMAVIAAALLYLPLFLIELRLGPVFHKLVYGYEHFKWHMVWRLGWYRPPVFLSHGITLGMWLSTGLLLACWLWRSGFPGRPLRLSVGLASLAIGASLVASRAMNGWGVFVCCFGTLLAGAATRTRWWLVVLALIPAIYVGSRVVLNWEATPIVEQVSKLNADRAASLRSRIAHEVLLIDHALERPIFGWGTYNRNRPVIEADDSPEGMMGNRSITDSLWIIALGQRGLVGLVGIGGVLVLPSLLAGLRVPVKMWRTPEFGPVMATAAICSGFAFDGLFNAMYTPVAFLGAGAVLGILRRPMATHGKGGGA